MFSLLLLCLLADTAGVVQGPDGKAVAGARVTVQNAQQTVVGSTVTSAAGAFEIVGLPDGRYLLRVSSTGFAEESLVLRVPAPGPLEIRMGLSPVRAEVSVTAEAGGVETGQETAQRVNALARGLIEERSTTSLTEAAEGEEGVGQQRTAPAMGAFFVRGLTGKGVAVYRDGVRYSTSAQRGGVSTFQNLSEAAHLDAIEFLRGPNSAQYGSDALGGVVHLVSSVPSFAADRTESHAESSLFYQSANHAFGAAAAGSLAARRFGLLYSFAGRRVNTLRTGQGLDSRAAVTRFFGLPSDTMGERLPDTGFTQYGGALHAQWQITPLRHFVAHYERGQIDGARRYDQLLGGDGNLVAELGNLMLDFGYLRLQSYRVGPFRQGWVGASYNAQREERANQGGQGNPAGNITRQYERTRALGLQGQLEYAAGAHTLLLGGDAYFERIASPATIFSPLSGRVSPARPRIPDGARYRQAGVFVQDAWEAHPNLRLSGAWRWSGAWYETGASPLWPADSMHAQALTGRAGAVWRIREGWNVHGQYARGFRAPNMTDLGSLGLQGNGIYEVSAREVEGRNAQVGESASANSGASGDPVAALRPEISGNIEGGFSVRYARWQAELTGFRMGLDRAMVSRTLLLPPGATGSLLGTEPIVRQTPNGAVYVDLSPNAVQVRANSGGAVFQGMEQSLRLRLGDQWTVSQNWTWIQARDRRTGLPPDNEPGVPAPYANLALLYAPAGRRVWLELYGTAAGRQSRLSTLALEDRRIGATRSRNQIAAFFQNGARVRGLVDRGLLLPTGETVQQVQNRVLGAAAAAPMFAAVAGYAAFGVRGGFPTGPKSSLLLDLSNLTDRNYRGVGWGVDAAGFGITVKWKVRL